MKPQYPLLKPHLAAIIALFLVAGLTAQTVQFRWPLRPAAAFDDFDYYTINNFVDHDPDSNELADFMCLDRTYDQGGYSHDGADIGLWPYSWNMMDAAQIDVVAAASGHIHARHDGEFDRSCPNDGINDPPNFVEIVHADGKITRYSHLKRNSVTAKMDGDFVRAGEYLGKVGSSGNSTGPHLHFEVRAGNGDILDPWHGPCSNGPNLWIDAKPYYEPAVVKMATFSQAATSLDCPAPAILPYKNHFAPGDAIRFGTYLRDLPSGEAVTVRVYRPDNSVQWEYTDQQTGSNVAAKQSFHHNFIIPGSAVPGTWKWEATFSGRIYPRWFTVGCTPEYTLSGEHTGRFGRIAGDFIHSSASISGSAGNNVRYEAEHYIRLDPGFVASAGCTFRARIDDCTIGATLPLTSGMEARDLPDSPQADESFTISPNPFTAATTIAYTLTQSSKVSLRVFNVLGTPVFNPIQHQWRAAGSYQHTFEANDLPAGIYLVVLEKAGERITKRVVLAR